MPIAPKRAPLSAPDALTPILQMVTDGVLVLDAQGCIHSLNPAAQRFFDATPQQVLGVALNDSALIPALRAWLCDEIATAGSGQRTAQFQLTDHYAVSVSVTALPAGWAVVVHDISHSRDGEAERMEFIRRAAHDLRGPLGVVRSSLNLMDAIINERDPLLDEVMGIANHRLEEMQAMVEDLLNLEEVSNRQDFHPADEDVYLLVREVADDSAAQLTAQRIIGTVAVGAVSPVTVDRRWLKLALMHCVNHAARFTPAGGTIHLSAFERGAYLHLEVADSSPAFAPEVQARLFERFYRPAVAEGHPRGTGLSLALVKAVAEAHGGMAYVRSVDGVGCVYGVTVEKNLTPNSSPKG